MIKRARGKGVGPFCAFCKAQYVAIEVEVERTKKLVEKGNANAFYMLAGYYAGGRGGLQQDSTKVIELYLKAGELGCAAGYFNLGAAYDNGLGVEVDQGKAKHYWELAAMGGDIAARRRLGIFEGMAGNHQRAMKHMILSARAGDEDSLELVKCGFREGIVTKDEYEGALRANYNRQLEMKSDTGIKLWYIIVK
jgi:TPR repeat protein